MDSRIVDALTKSSEVDQVIVSKRVKVDGALLRTAKKICREVFKKTDLADDEDRLSKDIRDYIDQQITEIKALSSRYEGGNYPGSKVLEQGLNYFNEFAGGIDNVSLFTKLRDLEDNLLNWEEDAAYVKGFFDNQKEIFDEGLLAFQMYKENKVYLPDKETAAYAEKLQEIVTADLPYSRIKEIPELVKQIDRQLQELLEEKKAAAKRAAQLDHDYLRLHSSQAGVSVDTKHRIHSFYDDLFHRIDRFTDIFKVDATLTQSAVFKEQQDIILNREIYEWKESRPDIIITENDSDEGTHSALQKEKVRIGSLLVVQTLSTEEDVDQLLSTISVKLKQIIKRNKQIEFIE
jgi:hypothetical protein